MRLIMGDVNAKFGKNFSCTQCLQIIVYLKNQMANGNS